MPKLSIVIPVYNEARTVRRLLETVSAVEVKGLTKEIIVVDDGSTDGTREILGGLTQLIDRLHLQEKNCGKGAAIRQGFALCTGDYVIVQDADLEYDPREYDHILSPLLDGRADVVYGSRFVGSGPHRVLFFWHYVGNRFLTLLSNMMNNLNLTDMETCYKAFRRESLELFRQRLTSNRFTIEVELTAMVAKHHLRLYEVGISYGGRTYAEGKKINWKDGLSAVWAIIKFNLF